MTQAILNMNYLTLFFSPFRNKAILKLEHCLRRNFSPSPSVFSKAAVAFSGLKSFAELMVFIPEIRFTVLEQTALFAPLEGPKPTAEQHVQAAASHLHPARSWQERGCSTWFVSSSAPQRA